MPRVLLAFEPPDGGVPENVLELASGLADEGWEAEVAGPAESTIYGALESAGTPVHRIGSLQRGYGRPDRDLAALGALRRLLRDGRFDVIHCHSAKAGALGRLAALRAGVPSVFSPHCFGFVGDISAVRRRLAATIERRLGPRTHTIICACDAERRRALEFRVAPPERLRRIYYGIGPCERVEPNPELVRLRDSGPVAAAVATLREQKRLDLLIDAAPRVFEQVPDARIAIVGEGPMREALEARAAALGLDRDPRFALLPFERPSAQHLRAIDVFVLPSAWEAMPIGVLEALACGVPQVVSDVEGTGEACADGETGLLVAPRDADALAAALVALLGDAERRERFARASRERHARLFEAKRMVAETAEVYAAAAAGA